MEVKVCRHCHRIFQSSSSNVCPHCAIELEAAFKVVKKYIRSHPDASVVEVSEACEINMEQIRQWIKDERIEYTKASVIGIECERCGVSIKTGRICQKCRIDTVVALKSVYIRKETSVPHTFVDESAPRMRFLSKKNNKRD